MENSGKKTVERGATRGAAPLVPNAFKMRLPTAATVASALTTESPSVGTRSAASTAGGLDTSPAPVLLDVGNPSWPPFALG
jgi:hypothetical protein